MSLIAFHIALMSVATLFSLALALWAFTAYTGPGDMLHLWTGVGSLVGGLTIAIYLTWFVWKIKKQSLLKG